MTARAPLVLLATAVLASQSAAASAQVRLEGHAATQTFVLARYIEVRAIHKVVSRGLSDMESEVAGIERGCPNVLAGAPAGSQIAPDVETELVLAVGLAFLAPQRGPISGFTGAMLEDHLRWHDRDLQRLVYAYVREQARFAAVRTPDFCADAKEWVASGYRIRPAGTRRVLQQLTQAVGGNEENDLEGRLARALRRHTTRAEHRLLIRIRRIEADRSRLLRPRAEAALRAAAAAVGAQHLLGRGTAATSARRKDTRGATSATFLGQGRRAGAAAPRERARCPEPVRRASSSSNAWSRDRATWSRSWGDT